MAIRRRAWTAPDGTARSAWQVSYTDQAGKRRAKQFDKKKEAEAFELTAKGEVRIGLHTPDSISPTISQAADEWLAAVRAIKPPREPTTIAGYDQHVRLHIVPKCGAVKLSQLSAPMVRAYAREWLSELSRPMAVRVLRSLRAIIAEAQASGKVAQNVAQAVRFEKVSRDKGKVDPPSKAALRAILGAAGDSKDGQGRAVVTLAIYSGLRASELRGLAWRSLDLKYGTVTVEQRADAKGTIGPPKSNAGRRIVPLPAGAVKALKEWKLACPPHPLDLVFPSPRGKPISHQVLSRNVVAPILMAAGEGGVTLHAFRHAAASLWIERGLNPKRVQYLMGHSSIQVTFDTYGHLFDSADKGRDDADAIERALFADAT